MEDDRVWAFEESLWTGDAQHYRESIDSACLMVVPMPPYVLEGEAAVQAVSDTPRWERVTLDARAHADRGARSLRILAASCRTIWRHPAA